VAAPMAASCPLVVGRHCNTLCRTLIATPNAGAGLPRGGSIFQDNFRTIRDQAVLVCASKVRAHTSEGSITCVDRGPVGGLVSSDASLCLWRAFLSDKSIDFSPFFGLHDQTRPSRGPASPPLPTSLCTHFVPAPAEAAQSPGRTAAVLTPTYTRRRATLSYTYF
jgi:hypothetical protein